MKKFLYSLIALGCFTYGSLAQKKPGKGYKDIKIDPSYEHTKWGVEPTDLIYNFAAYTTSFDSDDLNPCLNDSPANCKKTSDAWAIPEWVAYEIRKVDTTKCKPNYSRPGWMTDDDLNAQGIAADDASYKTDAINDLKEVGSNYRYVRGHMCPKDAADRISMEAGWNTHTMLNAVPQLQSQNNGIWKKLEEKCTNWANHYEKIWVVSGPVFANKNPNAWLGQYGEVKAAIPDAIFKVIIRKNGSGAEDITSLAFIFPNVIADDLNSAQEMKKFLTSIEDVQKKTSLKFLENMTDASKKNAELKRHHDIMEMRNALSSSQKKKPNKPDSLAQTAIDWWVELPIKWTKCN